MLIIKPLFLQNSNLKLREMLSFVTLIILIVFCLVNRSLTEKCLSYCSAKSQLKQFLYSSQSCSNALLNRPLLCWRHLAARIISRLLTFVDCG